VIKIEAIFQDARNKKEFALLTNSWTVQGVWCKCLYIFYSEDDKKWLLSWTVSNIHQLIANEKAGANKKVKIKELPIEAQELIQNTINTINKSDKKTIKQILTKGFKNVWKR
jgi:hypothetical protein